MRAERGLVLLNWGHGGWVHIFSARAINSLNDLRSARLFTASGDDGMVQWFKENGFNPVPLALSDVLMGLNQSSHMLDVPLGPLFGATVMTERAWARISEADRGVVLQAAATTQDLLFTAVPRQDREAIAAMQERGTDRYRGSSDAGRPAADGDRSDDLHVAREPGAG